LHQVGTSRHLQYGYSAYGMYRGERESTQEFWWRKLNEKDRLADEQIKSHELCRRTDPSVAKPNSGERLVISFTLRPL